MFVSRRTQGHNRKEMGWVLLPRLESFRMVASENKYVYKLYNNLSVGLLAKVVNQVKTYSLVLLLNKTKNFIRKNGY